MRKSKILNGNSANLFRIDHKAMGSIHLQPSLGYRIILYKVVKLVLIPFVFLFFLQEISAQPDSGKAHASIENQIDQLVKKAVRDNHIPGITVAISKNGKLVANKAYGYANYKDKKQMMPYHRTGIGSVSKIITTLGIMKLTEEHANFSINKKLFGNNGILKDPVFIAAYIKGSQQQNHPEWINWYANMRLSHLLSHTSGLVKNDGDTDVIREYYGINKEERIPLKQLVQYHLIHKKLKFEVGTKADYSNIGMGTFQKMIVLEVSGKEYGKYIDQKIFQPLGLHGDITNYAHTKDEYDSDRHVYDKKTGKTETLNWPEDYNQGIERVGAAGGWAASARSLIRIMVATDRLANYPDILKSSTLDLMETKPFPSVRNSHALGWGVRGKMLRHNGAGGGGKAELQKYLPGYVSNGIDYSGINVAVCVNYGNISLGKLDTLAQGLAEIAAKSNIPNSYDLFPITDPDPPSDGGGESGTIGKLIESYKWSEGWSSSKVFEINNHKYLMLLKKNGVSSKNKNVHINKVNNDGTIGGLIASYKWSEGWSDIEFFKKGSQTYLMMVKSKGFTSKNKNVHINKVNSNGTIGELIASYKWSEGWSDIEFFNTGGKTYLMLLKSKGFTSAGKNVHINVVNNDGTIGNLVADYKWGEGWTDAEFFNRGDQIFLMLLKEKGFTSKGQNVHINLVNRNGTIGNLVSDYKWSEGWTEAEFFKRGNQTFLMLLKEKGFTSKEKNAHINLVNSNGTIGALQASYKWSEGWSKANIFNEGSKSYLLMVKEKGFTGKGKNVHVNLIN